MEHLVPKMVVERLLMELDEEMTKLELAIQKRVSETILQSEEDLQRSIKTISERTEESVLQANGDENRGDSISRVKPSYRLSY
jgi:hypothetical protein